MVYLLYRIKAGIIVYFPGSKFEFGQFQQFSIFIIISMQNSKYA